VRGAGEGDVVRVAGPWVIGFGKGKVSPEGDVDVLVKGWCSIPTVKAVSTVCSSPPPLVAPGVRHTARRPAEGHGTRPTIGDNRRASYDAPMSLEPVDLLVFGPHPDDAVPHATAAWLARNILAASGPGPLPRLVTTLHGTDITIVGSDASYSTTVAFSIDQGDAVTAVSRSLREATVRVLAVRSNIDVINNFLDCSVFSRRTDAALRASLCPPDRYDALVMHLSNFRPVKRVDVAVEIFHRLQRSLRARLVLAGDGPDAAKVQAHIAEYGLDQDVLLLPAQQDVVALLSCADLFLLPSLEESFGLAALEAMACGVPVVASRVGGLPEVIDDGVTGALCEVSDVEGMALRGLELLTNTRLRDDVAAAARRVVVERFCVDRIVPQYEAVYRRVCEAEM
jgi:N-acetyl-alpha-D-glucosaminyl L-malate synthase BshA